MDDQHLRDLLLRAYESVPAEPFDPADDLARARAARTRRRATRSAIAATVLVVGASLAIATAPRSERLGGTLFPAGPSRSSAAPIATATATARPTALSPTTTAPTTTAELAQRMLGAIRANAAGSGSYLRRWGKGQSGAGLQAGSKGLDLSRFGIVVGWSRAGEKSTGAIELLSASSVDEESLRCGGYRADLPTARCKLVSDRGGSKVYYGSIAGVRAASISYADGREVSIIASSLQAGNSLAATTAPLPTRSELIAIVTDPGLAWPGRLRDTNPLGSPTAPGAS
jgi:hypothetical protein